MKKRDHTIFYDPWILSVGLVLVLLGLLMVSSASMVISDQLYHNPFHYILRQFIFLASGIGITWSLARIPLKWWEEVSFVLLLLCFFVLLVVLIPHVGRVVNGSRRWIHLPFISLQVSEAVKLMVILYMAGFLQRHLHEVQTQLSGFLKPMIFFAIIALLLLCEPDFGTTAVIAVTILTMLFVAGARLLPFMVFGIIIVGALVLLIMTAPYRLERITAFLHPWAHAYGSGYQLTQSLIAFGRGGIFGVGLGNSIQKLFYLPEAHTDFIFAVIGEELGLAGELLFIGLFVALIARIIFLGQTALRQEQWFGGFAAWGIALWLALQTIINLGTTIGLLPTKGLTLPLVSYGGSSLWMCCAAIGIVLRVAHEAQLSVMPPTLLARMRQRVS